MISKKELLQLTGISYGQLYRWKREGLIPESWFVKKSSYTGQETFFPKEKIVERIHAIQELKEHYSLDEVARMLSPKTNKDIQINEKYLQQIKDIDELVMKSYLHYRKGDLHFFDVILMACYSCIKKQLSLPNNEMEKLIESSIISALKLGSIDMMFIVFQLDWKPYIIVLKESSFHKDDNTIFYDRRMEIMLELSVSEVNDIFRKNNESLFKGGNENE